jgi:hypothetical protein
MTINEPALRQLLRLLTTSILDGDAVMTRDPIDDELGLTDEQSAAILHAWLADDILGMWDAAAAWTDDRVSLADLVVPRAGLLAAIASTRAGHLRADARCSCDEGCADCTPTSWHDGDGDDSLPIFEEDVADEQPF